MSTVLEPLSGVYEFQGNLALGDEQKKIVDWQRSIAANYWGPVSRQFDNPRLRFYALASQWREETRYVSSISQIATNPSYQQIIGMGAIAIPLILEELLRDAEYLRGRVLAAIGAHPLHEDHGRDVRDGA